MRKSKRQNREELLSRIMAVRENLSHHQAQTGSRKLIGGGGGVVACEGRNLHAIWCFNVSFAIVI